MTKHFAMPRSRGLIGVRAETLTGTPTEMLAALNLTFAAFREANDERLKALESGKGDVLAEEKVNRINSDISSLNKALDDANRMIAALRVGGGQDETNPHALEHASAFDKFFRRGVDANLAELQVKAALTTQSDPDGGFLVPKEVSQTIDRVLGTVSVLRDLATVMPFGSDTYSKFVNVGGTSSGWVGEEETRSETLTPQLRELEFNVMELYAFPFTTQKMLDDGIIDIAAWLADEVNIQFSEQEGLAFVTGDGNKKPRGLLGYDKVDNASYEWGKLGFTATGGAAGFAATDPADALMDLFYSLKQGYRNNATWLTSDVVMGSIRKFKDGNGNYLWAAPTAEMPATILGKPAATDDNMPALGANAFPIAFGDFKRGYMITDRAGIRVLRDPLTVKGKVGFYTTKRVGGGVANFEAIKLLKCSAT